MRPAEEDMLPPPGFPEPVPRELHDEEIVTQFGSDRSNPPFLPTPRRGKDYGRLSLILGQVDLELACELVPGRGPIPGDALRFTTIGLLRERGFIVEHTPERAFPQHASVTLPGQPDRWHADVKQRFQDAFNVYAERSGS